MFLKEDKIMKKILAGVLAAASVLSVGVTASAAANEKNVTKTGELTYDVSATAPKVVLNLVMPAKMTAALNPYGADIKLDAATTPTTTNGSIGSLAYEVVNKSEDYGVFIDATAITTITTTDPKKADKSNAWDVVPTFIAKDTGVKNANMMLVGSDTVANLKAIADLGAEDSAFTANDLKSKAATNATTQGALVLDSTVVADKTAGVVAGQTKQSKVLYVPASASGTDGKAVLGFVGKLAETKPATTGSTPAPEVPVVWNEDDAINVNLVLKVNVGPKSIT